MSSEMSLLWDQNLMKTSNSNTGSCSGYIIIYFLRERNLRQRKPKINLKMECSLEDFHEIFRMTPISRYLIDLMRNVFSNNYDGSFCDT